MWETEGGVESESPRSNQRVQGIKEEIKKQDGQWLLKRLGSTKWASGGKGKGVTRLLSASKQTLFQKQEVQPHDAQPRPLIVLSLFFSSKCQYIFLKMIFYPIFSQLLTFKCSNSSFQTRKTLRSLKTEVWAAAMIKSSAHNNPRSLWLVDTHVLKYMFAWSLTHVRSRH